MVVVRPGLLQAAGHRPGSGALQGGEASFGEQLRRFRDRAALSQEELAEQAALTAHAISALERGLRRRPYPHTVQTLATALGLSADERTAFTVAARRPSASPAATSAAPPPEARRTNLPHPPNPLIGRERDVEAVGHLLLEDHVRLVTVTGVGGGGKTRLALAVAADVANEFPDGVWLAELSALDDPALVAMAVATAFGVRESGGVSVVDALLAFLRQRSALLVLDNCEHLVEASAQLAERLLATCPDLRILATSREALQLAGERRYRVQPLAVPDCEEPAAPLELARSPAVALFLARAQAVESDFELTVDSSAAIAEICTQLAGIPLAIELAAARVGVLSVEQIRNQLVDCFRLLVRSGRTAPRRQRTLRATLNWSHDLLTHAEQTMFRRLAVFAGGCELEAAEAVCGDDVLDVLSGLVDKSLVLVDAGGTVARYRLLEPVRQYARQQLESYGEADAAQARQAAYYATLAERAEPELRGSGQLAWLERLDGEQDNLRAAIGWGVLDDGQHDPARAELGARLVGALHWYWYIHGHLTEGRRWSEAAQQVLGGLPARVRGRATVSLAVLLQMQGDYVRAGALLAEARVLFRQARDRWWTGYALSVHGLCTFYEGTYERAAALFKESLNEFRALDDAWGIGVSLACLGRVATARGEQSRAAELFEASVHVQRQVGDSFVLAQALLFRGRATLARGDYTGATNDAEECLHLFRSLRHRRGMGYALASLSQVARARGDRARTLALLAEGLALHAEQGDRAGVAERLEAMAGASVLAGRHGLRRDAPTRDALVRAARLMGAAEALREAIRAPLRPGERRDYDRDVAFVRAQLGSSLLESAWAEGHAMPLERAIEQALALADEPDAPRDDRQPPLTRRERDVARLIARGLTDRQIADELTIAASTVGVHVHRILAKLGLRSRWQIADWTMAHDPEQLRAAES